MQADVSDLVKEAAGGPATVKQAFTHPAAHPLLLNLLLLKEFGPEYLGWLPETVWSEVAMTWGTTVSESGKQKVQAVRACYVASDVHEEWQVFEKVAVGLMGMTPRMYVSQRPSPARALYALEVLGHVRDDKPQHEIARYCAAVLMDHGMLAGPGALQIADQYVVGVDKDLQARVVAALKRGRAVGQDHTVELQLVKARAVRRFADEQAALLADQVSRLVPR